MWLESCLTEDLSIAQMDCGSKKRVLENVAKAIAAHNPSISADDLFQNFIARERLGSTGIGEGIAIPHCRVSSEGKTICACVTLATPIDFDAVDQQPVDVIFAMVVPEDEPGNHLERLAALVKVLQNTQYVEALRHAQSPSSLLAAALNAQ